jgi:uncharacterized membrane protein
MDPTLGAALVAVIWGVSPIVHRLVLKHVSGSFILLISAITYFIAVFAYVFIWKRQEVYGDFKNGGVVYVPLLALTTFLGFFLTNLIYLYAVKYAPNINIVVIITALYPVITLIIASLWLKEYLSVMGLIGFALIVCGVTLMLYTSKHVNT